MICVQCGRRFRKDKVVADVYCCKACQLNAEEYIERVAEHARVEAAEKLLEAFEENKTAQKEILQLKQKRKAAENSKSMSDVKIAKLVRLKRTAKYEAECKY